MSRHTTGRVHNFNPGPSALPYSVLQKAQQQFMNFEGTGMSILEISHRSAQFESVLERSIVLLKELLHIPDEYDVLFIQGGASMQFSMIPMNLLTTTKRASYVLTGIWAERAFAEAKLFGDVHQAFSSKKENYRRLPALDELDYDDSDEYVHITTNNTIYGTQWSRIPQTRKAPLIADMSSDILSKPIDVSQFGLIYAGAQKNLGPSGVTVVIIRKDLLEKANPNIPTMLQYRTYSDHRSLYNTPPTFSIYMLSEMLQWAKEQGGVAALAKRNEDKAALIYDAIDRSGGFYVGHAEPNSRSMMNITFHLGKKELERSFIDEASREGFIGVAGHRAAGGCRISAYNAVPLEACEAFSAFMDAFRARHA